MKTLQDFKDEVTKRETIIYNTFALAVRELRSASVARICDIAAEEYASLRASEAIREKEGLDIEKYSKIGIRIEHYPDRNEYVADWTNGKGILVVVGTSATVQYELICSLLSLVNSYQKRNISQLERLAAKDKEIEQLREALENIALAVKHEASDLIVRTRLNTAFEVLSKNAHTESSGNPGQFTGPVVGIDETEFNNAR